MTHYNMKKVLSTITEKSNDFAMMQNVFCDAVVSQMNTYCFDMEYCIALKSVNNKFHEIMLFSVELKL